jgi:serine/threonine-protein kinase
MRMRQALALAALTSGLLAGPPVLADSAADKAAADALFDQGKQLMAAGKYAEACPKLEESQRLDPALGTQLNLADCYEHAGKSASAFGLFNAVARASEKRGDKDRAAEAGRRAGLLAPTLQKLAIVVPPATRIPGLEVRKDGELVGDGSWGSALPTDPGAHTIEASAPGHKAWSTVVRVDTIGSSASVEIPALDVLATPTGEAPPSFWGTQRIVGVSVGAVGLVGLAVATGLGVDAIQKNNASKAQCLPNNPSLCFPAGTDLRLSAGRAADASTALFVVGGAAVAAGLTVFFTAPSSSAPKATTGGLRGVELAPAVGPTSAALSLRGRW